MNVHDEALTADITQPENLPKPYDDELLLAMRTQLTAYKRAWASTKAHYWDTAYPELIEALNYQKHLLGEWE